MSLILKTLYIYISNLGIIVAEVFLGIFRGIGWILKKFFKFNKSSFSSIGTFFKRSLAFILVFAVLAGSIIYIISTDSKVNAVEIMLNGEAIGFAQSQNDADLAQALALNSLGLTATENLETKEASTEPINVKTVETLSKAIVSRLAPELIEVTEIYIDGELFCAVADRQAARNVFDALLKSAKKQYPSSAVSFAEEIVFSYAFYSPSDKRLWTADQLELSLKTLHLLSIRHAECEKNLSTVEFDTVEIQTNTLFMGDSRIRRDGINGKEYAIDLVTYIGDKKVLSEQLMSVSVEKPVSRIVERGIRAGTISENP